MKNKMYFFVLTKFYIFLDKFVFFYYNEKVK